MKIRIATDNDPKYGQNKFLAEDLATFEEKKEEMLHRIGETLYQTLYKYLEFLNHTMVVCADT